MPAFCPNLGPANLVPEPPAHVLLAVTTVPIVQHHIDCFRVPWAPQLAVHWAPVVVHLFGVVANQSLHDNLVGIVACRADSHRRVVWHLRTFQAHLHPLKIFAWSWRGLHNVPAAVLGLARSSTSPWRRRRRGGGAGSLEQIFLLLHICLCLCTFNPYLVPSCCCYCVRFRVDCFFVCLFVRFISISCHEKKRKNIKQQQNHQ